jgi:hypothetical protein
MLKLREVMTVGVLLLNSSATGWGQQPEPPPNTQVKATVYFYRERAFNAMLGKMPIFMDENQIADLVNGRYFVANLPPGRHIFRCRTKLEAIAVDLKPGAEYYLRAELIQSFTKNHWRVIQVMNDQGKGDVRRLKPLEPKYISTIIQ